MPSKQDLEREIIRLSALVSERQFALNLVSQDNGCVVVIPSVNYAYKSLHAPNAQPGKGGKDRWHDGVMAVIGQIVREQGVCLMSAKKDRSSFFHHTDRASDIRLVSDGGYQGMDEHYLVPRLVGEMIVGFINATSDYAHGVYAKGFEEGSALLASLVRGDMTVDEFDDSIQQKKARAQQANTDYRRVRVEPRAKKRAAGGGKRRGQ